MNLAEYRATVAKVPNAFLQHVVYDGLDAGVSRASGVPRSQVEIFAGGATRVQQLKIDVGCLIHLLLDHVVVALDLLRVAFPYTRNHFECSVQGHRDGAVVVDDVSQLGLEKRNDFSATCMESGAISRRKQFSAQVHSFLAFGARGPIREPKHGHMCSLDAVDDSPSEASLQLQAHFGNASLERVHVRDGRFFEQLEQVDGVL